MNEQKLAGLMGFAIRARQAAAGSDACRIMIRSGKCGVLLADGSAGENTRKKAEDLCRQSGTPLMVLPPGTIEKATGRDCRLLGIRKGSFSEGILKMKQTDGEDTPLRSE